MNLELSELKDRCVKHVKYGTGVIKEIEGKHLTVFFDGEDKTCSFIYPVCFDKFLKLEDQDISEKVAVDLQNWKHESGESVREEMGRRHRKTYDAIKTRRRMAEEKKVKAAQRAAEMRMGHRAVRERSGN